MDTSTIVILGLHFGALCIVMSRLMRRDRLNHQRTAYLTALVNWHSPTPVR